MRRRFLTPLLLCFLPAAAANAQSKDYMDVTVDIRVNASCDGKQELVRTTVKGRLKADFTPSSVAFTGTLPATVAQKSFNCSRTYYHRPTRRTLEGEERFTITPRNPGVLVSLVVMWPSEYVQQSMTMLTVGLDVGSCKGTDHAEGRQISGGSSGYSAQFGGGTQDGAANGDVTPAVHLTKADVTRGFSGSYTLRGNALCGTGFSDGTGSGGAYDGTNMGDHADAIATVTMNYRQAAPPQVVIEPCRDIVVGQAATVKANGSPAGGSYRWSATAGMTAQGTGATASLLGSRPGTGTVKVQYTAAGRTVSDEESITCMQVKGLNGGAPIPQIGLYGVDGKPLRTPLQVSVQAEPADARDRLSFQPADAAVLSVASRGDALILQGLAPGRTLIRGRTSCGQSLGNGWPVEVKRCTDEVAAKIDEERRIAAEAIREQVSEIGKALGDDEFTKAADGLGEKSGDLILKTGTMIIGTLSGGKGTAANVKTASDIIGHASGLKDVITAPNAMEGASSVLGEFVSIRGSAIQQAIAGAIDLVKTAHEFGDMLGKVAGTNEVVENARKWLEHYSKIYEDADRRAKICKAPPAAPPAAQKQQPPTGKQQQPQRRKSTPPEQSGQTSKGEQGKPASPPSTPPRDGPSPPPPTTGRGPTGLPYSAEGKGACSCTQPAGGLAVGSAANLASVGVGLQGMASCNDSFTANAQGYTDALKSYDGLLAEIGQASGLTAAQRAARVSDWKKRIDDVVQKSTRFDQAGKALLQQGESCPAALDAAVGVLGRATGSPGTK